LLLPIGFDAPTARRPIATYVLVSLCVVAYLLSGDFPYERSGWARALVAWTGDVEAKRRQLEERKRTTDPVLHAISDFKTEEMILDSAVHWSRRPWTLLTCTFLHGDIMHLVGNMVFLLLFGRAVNGWLGNLRYTLLYLALGGLASVGHILFGGGHFAGLVGASGAIAGAMGLAASVFPKYRVRFFYFFMYRMGTFQTRAFWALVLWFAWDLVQALLVMSADLGNPGVAFMAHVVGFAGGLGAGAVMLKTGQAERHDGDILNWFTGAPERRERQRLHEYIDDMSADMRKTHIGGLEEALGGEPAPPAAAAGAGRPPGRSVTAGFDRTPARSRTAAFDASPASSGGAGAGAAAGSLAAEVTRALLAASLDASLRAPAIDAYRQLVSAFPSERLPVEALRAAAQIAHLERDWELEVSTAERYARSYPADPALGRVLGRAATVCRQWLGDPDRAARLSSMLSGS
jgi:membrane associated rhomboid family serine protease